MSQMSDLVLITDGAWRISGSPRDGSPHLRIQHKCHGGYIRIPSEPKWQNYIFHWGNRGWMCSWCKNRPPDGIQAMFWFLSGD